MPARARAGCPFTRHGLVGFTQALDTADLKSARALRDIARLARETEQQKKVAARRLRSLDAPEPTVWSLALDEIRDTGVELRPRLPFNGPRDFTGPARVSRRAALAAAAVPLSQLLKPIDLDPLTVADDSDFLSLMKDQPNVPDAIRNALPDLY